jgi:formate hydrogenlyase subunit 6/NADH:ubiquinone oxidoreductase subunit I
MAIHYVIGIWEFHVNDLDPDLIRDMNEYTPILFNNKTWQKAPQLRTVPIGKSIPVNLEALPYEKVEELIKEQTKFLVAPCICRKERKLIGEGCEKPEDACLVFGKSTDYYRKNGLGRMITKDEALEILKNADEAGLVLQPNNSLKLQNICCCCGCCCQVLKSIKRHPRPAEIVSSPFVVSVDNSGCIGCGVCVQRCQMDALSLDDDRVVLDSRKCIGCGLCVSTCLTDSLTLVRKPDPEQKEIPKNQIKLFAEMAKARGKSTPFEMSKIKLRSQGSLKK